MDKEPAEVKMGKTVVRFVFECGPKVTLRFVEPAFTHNDKGVVVMRLSVIRIDLQSLAKGGGSFAVSLLGIQKNSEVVVTLRQSWVDLKACAIMFFHFVG